MNTAPFSTCICVGCFSALSAFAVGNATSDCLHSQGLLLVICCIERAMGLAVSVTECSSTLYTLDLNHCAGHSCTEELDAVL